MRITPEDIISNSLRGKSDCKDCKYGHFLGDYDFEFCEHPKRPVNVIGNTSFNTHYKRDLNKDGHCPIFVYKPPLKRQIKKFLRRKIKWCYWHWEE